MKWQGCCVSFSNYFLSIIFYIDFFSVDNENLLFPVVAIITGRESCRANEEIATLSLNFFF